jgi:2-methylisocitrate lyase-like PEP mutase family enzyme
MTKAESFAALHVPGTPLIIYNIWDAGSAKAVAGAGAKAIATGSWGVAGAHGMADGEKFPLDLAIANLERIVAITDLPVSIDLEAGYGADAAAVEHSARRAFEAGAVGINLEDKDPATRLMFDVQTGAARVQAAASTGLFVNARCDLFILAARERHNEALVDEAITRGHAYAAAGAQSLFLPYLVNPALIERACKASPLPVNILMHPDGPDPATLAKLGAARISYGHGPWAAAMASLEADARAAFAA